MLIIGLTGGIGCGKTTVANYFAALGTTVIDADQIAREVTAEKPVIETIIQHFGTEILNQYHQLNRSKLREIIFNDAIERDWLEKLLHPLIARQIELRLKDAKSAYAILVIPLLLEKGRRIKVDRILVVDATEKLQAQRVQQRDQITEAQFDAILRSQASRDMRMKHADDVIENNGSLVELKEQVEAFHQKYLILSNPPPLVGEGARQGG